MPIFNDTLAFLEALDKEEEHLQIISPHGECIAKRQN
jgi:hypothetical protein